VKGTEKFLTKMQNVGFEIAKTHEEIVTYSARLSAASPLLHVNGGMKVYQRGGAKVYHLAQGNGP
jgi:hypothetical protein